MRRGALALVRASTPITEGLYRAETVSYDELIEAGGLVEAQAGQAALMGKEYVVQDGDVLNIRYNL